MKISLLSALSPFLKYMPWGGQARLGEPPGLPGKHGVMLGRGCFWVLGGFFVFLGFFNFLSFGNIAMVTWGKRLASISLTS